MPQTIGALIPKILQETTKVHEALHRVQRRWPQLVGRDLAAQTQPVGLRRGTLYVHTDSPGASFVLSLERPRLLARLRRVAGRPIEELVVRPGPCPTGRRH